MVRIILSDGRIIEVDGEEKAAKDVVVESEDVESEDVESEEEEFEESSRESYSKAGKSGMI